ncbi:hypothetical protein AAFF_G00407390 [Aldrovandia affinis]|uniref:Uncharacterized protein n=1 Tax=Aldrovandia affinis TaxID=143900 RepID=A0AAD7VYP4_9TELE|nr:hypothetical protein AAFF_G00407390 [Aldrovandia affinis]
MPYTSTPGDGLSSSEEDEEAALGTRRRLRFGEVYIGKPQAGKRISLPDMGATLSQTKMSKERRMGHGSSMGKLEETLAQMQDSHARRIREMEERLHHGGSESCELDDLLTLTNGRQGPESAAARKEQAPALAQTDRLTNEHFTRLRNKTNRAIENSFAALYDIARSNAAAGECTTLRNGKQVPKEPAIRRQVMEKNSMPEKKEDDDPEVANEESEGEGDPVSMNPIVVKNGRDQYTPWSFMDMVGLAGRLPDLTEGAGKWITALEESTGGIRLALGDMKALLMHVVGKHVTDGIFQQTGLSHLRDGHVADYVGFNGHRTKVWGELRRLYPDKLDPSKLEGEELKEGAGMAAHSEQVPPHVFR